MQSQEQLNKIAKLIIEAQDIGFQSFDKGEKSMRIKKEGPGVFYVRSTGKEEEGHGAFFERSTGKVKEVPNPRVIEIGKELYQIGGLRLMQEVFYEIVRPFGPLGTNLKWVWDGVGDWQA